MSDSDEELSFASVDDADEEKISGTVTIVLLIELGSHSLPT